jgi:hypothetical protein
VAVSDSAATLEGQRGFRDGFFGIPPSEGAGHATSPIYWQEHRRGSQMREELRKAQAEAKKELR